MNNGSDHTIIVKDFSKFLISIIGCELVGILSTPFTISAISTWYIFLNKPPFSPPNWVFGPVWTILYFLMGISAFLVWRKGLKNKKVKKALFYFLLQLFFNFLWSLLFFGLHSPLLGLLDIIVLLVSIVITLVAFYRVSKIAAYLLIPYLLWVSFATILNLSIVLLNK
ncbi:MAG: tryptophan-rich sensory protein [Candidatus Levybacteria bacterium]|nr:tryptophan-rich sensory protein [Candidatus Levybacteria bacterium]